jgi:O-antigen/teichoic acid export membrane protein
VLAGLLGARGSAARGAALLAGGTVLAQALNLLLAPVLTRLYPPEAFGALASFGALCAMLSPMATARFELAIPLPAEESTARALVRLSFGMAVGVSLCFGVIASAAAPFVTIWFGDRTLGSVLWLLTFGVFGTATLQIMGQWAVRQQQYGALARTKLVQASTQALVQLGGGALGLGAGAGGALVTGDVVGRVSGAWALWRATWTREVLAGSVRAAASTYRRFALQSMPATILNMVAPQMPALLFAKLYGLEVAGWYALAHRLLAAPISLLGQSLATVYQAEGARLVRENPAALPALFDRYAWRLVILGALPLLLVSVLAPWFVPFAFGARWTEAGLYVQALSLAYAAELIVSPLSSSATLVQRQGIELVVSITRVLLLTLLFGAAIAFEWPALDTVRAFAGMLLFTYLGFFVMYRKVIEAAALGSIGGH